MFKKVRNLVERLNRFQFQPGDLIRVIDHPSHVFILYPTSTFLHDWFNIGLNSASERWLGWQRPAVCLVTAVCRPNDSELRIHVQTSTEEAGWIYVHDSDEQKIVRITGR